MSSELKPVAYLHYWIGGYPPDGYVEESELLTPFQAEAYKDLESNEAHGIVPLVIVPEGYQLVPIEMPFVLLRMIYNDVNSRCLAEEFEPSEIAYELYKAFVKSAKEQGE